MTVLAFSSTKQVTSPTRLQRRYRTVVVSATTSWTGKNVLPPENGHHFLHIDDFSKEELIAMLDTALDAKDKLRNNDKSFKPFEGKTLAMIFTKPSMRTRVSFETVRSRRRLPERPLHRRALAGSFFVSLNRRVFVSSIACGVVAGILSLGRPCIVFGSKRYPTWEARAD